MLTIHLLFLASGAAALIYQIVWFKQLQLVLGSSTYSVSVTIASFFLGLGCARGEVVALTRVGRAGAASERRGVV